MITVEAGAVSSCFGGTEATLTGLAAGRPGIVSLAACGGFALPGVDVVYADPTIDVDYPDRAEQHLLRAWGELEAAGSTLVTAGTAVIVCTGLGRAAAVERGRGRTLADASRSAMTTAGTPTAPVYSITNACSASGMGLALATMLLDSGAHDRVVLAAADSMSRSMLSMIGKVAAKGPAARCQPFDIDRRGAVLGEGAAVCVVSRDADRPGALGRVLSTAVSTDAAHLTAPDPGRIARTVEDALELAGCTFAELDLVVPHGTATERNDSTEIDVYRRWDADLGGVTLAPLKGLIGHTSGASFLMSMISALHFLGGAATAAARPEQPMVGAETVTWSDGQVLEPGTGRAMVSAYGFGGVNAVAVVSR